MRYNLILKFLGGLIFILYFLLTGSFCFAQTVELSENEQAEVEFIKSIDERILYSEEKTLPIYDLKTLQQIGSKDVVNYSYAGNEIDNQNILFNGTDKFSSIEILTENTFKISEKPKFYKNDNGQVQEIIDEQTSPVIWNTTAIPTTIEKIKALLWTPYTMAEPIYADSEDGYIYSDSTSTWNAARNAGSLTLNYPWGSTNLAFTARHGSSNYYAVIRGYLVFPTADLDESKFIATSSIFLYGKTQPATTTTAVITGANQGSTLATGDFYNVTDVAFSNTINNSVWTTSGYNEFVLNEAGIASTSLTDVSYYAVRNKDKDVDNVQPTYVDTEGVTDFHAYPSEETGTNKDPYLIVNLTEEEEEPEEPTATTTSMSYSCEDMLFNQKCVITSYGYNNGTLSTTTAISTFNYMNFLFLLLEILIGFVIITGIIKFKFK